MSPRKITRLALIIGAVSILGMVAMMVFRPSWGALAWWPALGLGMALLLLVFSFLRGAYLTAQKRVEMVEMLNDCYSGVPAGGRHDEE
ncbi:MAG: hypothetical protein L6R45_11435 [Anaerolineae bacterium]|nr:hypothetical protein [Anaerolineae bacterium]